MRRIHWSAARAGSGVWLAGVVTLLCSALTALAAPDVTPAGPPPAVPLPAAPSRDALEFFETKIRPVLATRCGNCHAGPAAAGKLDVNSRERLLSGGAHGPALIPGSVDESLLIRTVRRVGPIRMPPANPLPPNEVADLEAWVKQGAAWTPPAPVPVRPGKQFVLTAADRGFWAYQPVHAPEPPALRRLKNASPIDRFLLARLEAKGITPPPWADRRTLIRRATFDLTGLPPTPAEIDAFLADDQPGAFARVIDRLLASPRYGERWGRHWLDSGGGRRSETGARARGDGRIRLLCAAGQGPHA